MKLFLTLISSLFFHTIFAQYQIPAFKYDDVEVLTEAGNVYRKNFKKNGVTVLEAHYPNGGLIQSLCFKSRVAADSVYIFHAPVFKEINFWQRGGEIGVKSWDKDSGLVTFETYFADGRLKNKYSGIAMQGGDAVHPACAENYIKVKEAYKYNADGEELSYMNYDTGEGRFKDKTFSAANIASLEKLKASADQIVREHYGEGFFKQYIKPNYRKSAAHHPSANTYRRNNGFPNSIVPSDTWFMPEDERISYADISYYIQLEDGRLFDLITVRLDSVGGLVSHPDYSLSGKPNFTTGLLVQPAAGTYLTVDQALAAAKTEGLPVNDKDLQVGVKWEPAEKSGSAGTLYYQFLFNKLNKRVYGCNMFFYEEWLVNPFTKAIKKDGEVTAGECEPELVRRKNENGKYGYIDAIDGSPIIPIEYDVVPKNFSYCMIVRKGDEYGCINDKNKILIPFEYDHITYVDFTLKRYHEDFLVVKKGDKLGLYNNKGEAILPIEYTKITSKDAHSIVALNGDKEAALYNCKTGKVVKK